MFICFEFELYSTLIVHKNREHNISFLVNMKRHQLFDIIPKGEILCLGGRKGITFLCPTNLAHTCTGTCNCPAYYIKTTYIYIQTTIHAIVRSTGIPLHCLNPCASNLDLTFIIRRPCLFIIRRPCFYPFSTRKIHFASIAFATRCYAGAGAMRQPVIDLRTPNTCLGRLVAGCGKVGRWFSR